MASAAIVLVAEVIVITWRIRLVGLRRRPAGPQTVMENKYEKNADLHRMAAMLRAEIRKACQFQVGQAQAESVQTPKPAS